MMPLTHRSAVEPKTASERPQTGFDLLLEQLISDVRQTDDLKTIVHRLLTLGGRQSLALGLRSLTPRQSALLDLMGHAVPQHRPLSDHTGSVWRIGIWNYGRILLTDNSPYQDHCQTLAYLPVSSETIQRIESVVATTRAGEARVEAEKDEFFRSLDDERKQHVRDSIWHGLDHIDPVLVYVNESTFTNFNSYNTLLNKPNSLLERMPHTSVESLTPDEKHFIFCFYWALQAGFRGEEFNGIQLTPRTLDAYFDARLRRYSKLTGAPFEVVNSIAGKAAQLRQLRQDLSRNAFIYRRVNGLNFHKQERVASRAAVKQNLNDLPLDLRRYIEDTYNLQISSFKDFDHLARACVEKAVDANAARSDLPISNLELLLRKIVLSAVEALSSDVGMTRGIRNIRSWQVAIDEKRFFDICQWPTTDYFCGVFPSAVMRQRFKAHRDQLVRILLACSVRMQFNSWHYMPGHFPPDSIPPGRHFYYPPRMPDTAIWADQHHAGHVKAGVRFSIRSPAPLEYRNRIYAGMIDLRLYRVGESAYTRAELMKAIKYTEYLRAVYQAVADIVATEQREIIIESFTKDWYERHGTTNFDPHNLRG